MLLLAVWMGAGMFANSFLTLVLPLREEWVYQGLYFASAVVKAQYTNVTLFERWTC